MARRGRSDSGPLRWLLVPLIPVGALFAYFSLFNYSSDRQCGTLVIGAEESAFYEVSSICVEPCSPRDRVSWSGTSWTRCRVVVQGMDRAPTQDRPSYHAPSLRKAGCERWRQGGLRSADGGYLIKFPADDPFNGQRQIALFPVGASGMALKFGEVLAAEMGLIVPELSYVHLTVCGEDHGVHAKEERIGDTFFEKRQLTGFSLFEQGFDAGRPDHLFPNCEEDSMAAEVLRARLILAQQHDRSGSVDPSFLRMSDDQVIAWALMVWLEQREDMLCDEALFAYDRNTGNTFPLYRAPRIPVDPHLRPGYDLARHPLLLRIQDRRASTTALAPSQRAA